jgi:translation initiation factor 3 subunit B
LAVLTEPQFVTLFFFFFPFPVSLQNWTESEVQWSPKGTYLATFHRQGIALWGGPNFDRIARFAHPGVRYIDFSPSEEYLVSYSEDAPESKEDPGVSDFLLSSSSQQIVIWNIRTGKKIRGFNAGPKPVHWPALKWSANDKYVARLGENVIAIYETPAMQLLDKQPLKVEGVKEFSWSPKDNLLAYWVPEMGNSPARVTIVDAPGKNVKATKNLFNVSDVSLFFFHVLCFVFFFFLGGRRK